MIARRRTSGRCVTTSPAVHPERDQRQCGARPSPSSCPPPAAPRRRREPLLEPGGRRADPPPARPQDVGVTASISAALTAGGRRGSRGDGTDWGLWVRGGQIARSHQAPSGSSGSAATRRTHPVPSRLVVDVTRVLLVGAASFAEEITDLCRSAGRGGRGLHRGPRPARRGPHGGSSDHLGRRPGRASNPTCRSSRRSAPSRGAASWSGLVAEGRRARDLRPPDGRRRALGSLEEGVRDLPDGRDRRQDTDRAWHDRQPRRPDRPPHVDRRVLVPGPGANVAGKVRIGTQVHVGIGAIVRDRPVDRRRCDRRVRCRRRGRRRGGVTVVGIPARPLVRA